MNNYSKKQVHVSKSERQRALVSIIRNETIRTQSELARHLKDRGISCTQVSVSRDIRELRLVKRSGRYTEPEDSTGESQMIDELASSVSVFLKEVTMVGENLIVVKTLPGTAHSVGSLLDRVDWEGLVGTVAGDDTIFIATFGREKGGQGIARNLQRLMRNEE